MVNSPQKSDRPKVADSDRLISPRMARCAAALLICESLNQAAEICGVSPRTLRRYRSNPAFQEALRTAYRNSLEEAIMRSAAIGDEAVKVLRGIACDPTQPAPARVTAAKYLDVRHWRLVEIGTLQERLDKLQKAFESRGNNQ